jgi:hypothetical protein
MRRGFVDAVHDPVGAAPGAASAGGIAVPWQAGYGGGMTAQPTSVPDEPYEVIHRGD